MMARTREDYLQQLALIQKEAVDANEWLLSDDEIRYLKTTINTLIFIVNNIDLLKNYKDLYSNEALGIAPIHMENYHQHVFKFKIDIEKMLFISLVEPFIDNYQMLKIHGLDVVNKYLSLFRGFCIDARVREAFIYAGTFGVGETFTDAITHCKSRLPTASTQSSYSWLLAAIMRERWGQSYLADKGDNAFIKAPGVINETSMHIIDNYLRAVLQAKPNMDFLRAYQFVPEAHRDLYFEMLFKQIEFMKGQPFAIKEQEEKVANPEIAQHTKAIQYYKKQLINEFMSTNYFRLLKLLVANKIHASIMEQLNKETTLMTVLEQWKTPHFLPLLNTLTPAQITIVISCLLQVLKNYPNKAKETISTSLEGNNKLLHLAVRTNDPTLVSQVMTLYCQEHESLWTLNDNQESAVMIAAKHQCTKVTSLFLEEEKEDTQKAYQQQECSKAAVHLAHWGLFEAVTPFIQAHVLTNYYHPETHYSLVHYAVQKNQTPSLESMLEAEANINQIDPQYPEGETPLISAVKNTPVTIQTMATLLSNPKIDLNKKSKGESALFIAAKTNQFDKLYALLCMPNIDTEARRLPGDGKTALNIAIEKKHKHIIDLLTLYQMINDLLDNKLAAIQDTKALHVIDSEPESTRQLKPGQLEKQQKKRALAKAQMIQDLYDAILRKRHDSEPTKQRVQYILNECMSHILKVPQPPTSCNLIISFAEINYDMTTATLNQLFNFIGTSTEPDAHSWQESLRLTSLAQLNAERENNNYPKAILEKARHETIFSDHRNSFFAFGFGRTNAQKHIDKWLADLATQEKQPNSNSLKQ